MSIFLDWTWASSGYGEIGPGMFSWFHILWLFIMVAFTVLMCVVLGRKHSDRIDRWVIGIFAVTLLLCEIFKQLFWYTYYQYYRWEIFPFQFCSMPIYASLLATAAPWKRVREVCYRFLAFFGVIGGLSVMLVPTAVLETYYVPISVHSMLWHTILVAMGLYLIVSRGYGKNFRELLTPFCVFLGCVAVALVINLLVYHLYLNTDACQPGDNISMFYISPYYETYLPLLGAVQKFSYPLFLVSYIAAFSGFSAIVWGLTKTIRMAVRRKVAV